MQERESGRTKSGADPRRVRAIDGRPVVAILIGNGFAWNESLLAFDEFVEAGAQVTFYTPDGTPPMPDPMNTRDVSTVTPFLLRPIMRLYADVPSAEQNPTSASGIRMTAATNASKALSQLDPSTVDIVYVVGGFGASMSLETPSAYAVIRAVHDAGKLVTGVCHGTGVIANTLGRDDRSIATGRRFSGTQRWAEALMKRTQVREPAYLAQPLNSAVLRRNGVRENPLKQLIPGDIEVDGAFVTGMGPASAANVARRALAMFASRYPHPE